MSANNYIRIKQRKDKKWHVSHRDADTGMKSFGEFPLFNSLEEATKAANDFTKEVESDGGEIEYGLQISTNL